MNGARFGPSLLIPTADACGPTTSSGALVEKALEYMAFKKTYENLGPKEELPINEFMERIPPEVALEL